jgi:two-component system sensor histidine kinase/response regulator
MRGARLFFFWLIVFTVQHATSLAQTASDSVAIARQLDKAYKTFLTRPDSAIKIAEQSLAKSVDGKHKYLQGYSYYVLSKAFWTKANFRMSTEYGFKALKIFERSAYVFQWGESYLSLARTFIDLRNYPQARRYLKEAHELATSYENKRLLADTYREESMLYTETHDYDSAVIFADRGIALYIAFKDSVNLSILLSRKSKVFYALGDYRNSTIFNRKSLTLDALVGNNRGLGISYFMAAQNAYALNNLDSAIYFLNKSIPLNKSLDNFAILAKIHNLLADIYLKKGNASIAVDQLKIASSYKDSLHDVERVGQIQEMQSLYELESKNKTIDQLGKENAIQEEQVRAQKLFVIFQWAAIVLLGVLIILLVRLRYSQKRTNAELQSKNHAIELQREEIQSQAENLQNLNDLKSKLFSVISHDLRGPIASLHALLELLTSKRLTEEEFLLFSGKLKTNISITQRTLENLLNWSLSQMEGIKTEKEIIDIKIQVEDSCRLMEELATRKNIALVNTISESTHVKVDPNQLQLILRNLIHNAIKFSKTNQEVCIAAHCSDGLCEITIKDSGIGMNPDEINLIIGSEHFTKVGTQQEKGTGLGLLLCNEFIKRNGGNLRINSKEGEGTEIIITFELAK